jgi:hypothetical protein
MSMHKFKVFRQRQSRKVGKSLKASSADEINAVLVSISEQLGGLLAASDSFLSSQSDRIISFATQRAVPTTSLWRDFAVDGGLMSYGQISTMPTGRPAFIWLAFSKEKSQPISLSAELDAYILPTIRLRPQSYAGFVSGGSHHRTAVGKRPPNKLPRANGQD